MTYFDAEGVTPKWRNKWCHQCRHGTICAVWEHATVAVLRKIIPETEEGPGECAMFIAKKTDVPMAVRA